TFYVWRRRRESGDEDWFKDLSHAVDHCPHATCEELVEKIIAMRRKYPFFGPIKIKKKLETDQPGSGWPAASTIGDILKSAGLVERRGRRRRAIAQNGIVASAKDANDEWAIDFKGWFRTRDGRRCDPLTISDTASRYLIDVRTVEPTTVGVKCALERVFDTY